MADMKPKRRAERRAIRTAQERKRKLGTAILLGIILLALVYLTWGAAQPAEPLADEAVIALGAQVYAQSCASCHGDQGEGHILLPQAPALDDSEHAWHHPDGQLLEFIRAGGAQMPAFGEQLEDDEIVAVIRYFQTWWTADQLASQQRASEANPLR